LLYTVGFTIGRLSGIAAEGTPNEFVSTWLITEVISGALAASCLYFLSKSKERVIAFG
jgi:hypothetical protein